MSDDLPLYPPPLYTPPLPPHTDTRHAGHSVLLTFYRVHTDLEMPGGGTVREGQLGVQLW